VYKGGADETRATQTGHDDFPRTATASVVTLTLETKPTDATHWSTRAMAKRCGMTQTAISRIWRAFALQPHRSETFKLSTDPLFVDKVRDIVGLYLSPPEKALVLCVDEKSQIRPWTGRHRCCRWDPGRSNGAPTTMSVTEPPPCLPLWMWPREKWSAAFIGGHRAAEFRKFLDTIGAAVGQDLDLHLILDNYATHKTASIRRWLAKRPRYHVHFTPTGAPWINLVERWFAELTNKQLQREAHRSTRALETAIRDYLRVQNQNPRPFVWTKSADEILASVARFCERTSNSGD
jgi:transposase